MKKHVVYRHLFPNGKSYIGITSVKPVSRRWRGGSSYKSQPKLYRAIMKYGLVAIEHEILVDALTLHEANSLEQEFIKVFDSVACGYNVSTGGGGTYGIPCSESKKAAISKANTGKPGGDGRFLRQYVTKNGAWNKGKMLSDIHRYNVAKERKQRCSKRIGAFLPGSQSLAHEFSSCTEAATAMNVSKNVISRCAKGGRKTSAGYEWRYLNDSQ